MQQFVIEQRIEHNTGGFLDLRQHPVQLLLGSYQRIDVLHRQHLGVLRGRRARDGRQSLAGRVGDEVQVEIAAGAMSHDGNGMTCEFLRRRPWTKAERKGAMGKRGPALHTVALRTWRRHHCSAEEENVNHRWTNAAASPSRSPDGACLAPPHDTTANRPQIGDKLAVRGRGVD